MAFDSESGIISPGAVGYDINCGIRLIKTNLTEKELRPKLNPLLDALFKNVPSGVGSRLKTGLTLNDLEKTAMEGVGYALEKGYGVAEDLERAEENGAMTGADFSKVSKEAKTRGIDELGTLGAGNHFLEVQKVESVLDAKTAKAYGLFEGQMVVMVHCGSRGFGHQICSDYLRSLVGYQAKNDIQLVDRELSYARIGDAEADDYLSAMKCAVNYAFANRQMITHAVRKSFEAVFGKSADALGMDVLYDVAHNIAKLEEHTVEGKRVKVYVHRKGATRAFAKGREEVPREFRGTGQPVLIPGSMGTASYVLCGLEGAMRETFGTTCHGSGRVMSRSQALREIPGEQDSGVAQEQGHRAAREEPEDDKRGVGVGLQERRRRRRGRREGGHIQHSHQERPAGRHQGLTTSWTRPGHSLWCRAAAPTSSRPPSSRAAPAPPRHLRASRSWPGARPDSSRRSPLCSPRPWRACDSASFVRALTP